MGTCWLWFLSHCPLLYTWLWLQLRSAKPNVEVKNIKAPAAPEKKGEQVSSLMWLFNFYGGRSPEKCCSCKLLMHLIQWHGFKRKTTLCMFLWIREQVYGLNDIFYGGLINNFQNNNIFVHVFAIHEFLLRLILLTSVEVWRA